MAEVAVIIPARKEMFLAKTVASIAAARRGDCEIIAVIDGEHEGPAVPELPGVRVIEHETPQGQRASVNEAARATNARFILKTDGHSMLDEGFDVKLAADCAYDWTVLPSMVNLHAFDLICGKCGARCYNHGPHRRCPQCTAQQWTMEEIWRPNWRKRTDWMWFRAPYAADRPLRVQYWGQKDLACQRCGRKHDAMPTDGKCEFCGNNQFAQQADHRKQYRSFKRWAKGQAELADVMTGQGACFFMHRARFLELGGLDEGHGSWGQVGVEVACKAWLSGGRHVVNRKTWFAHLFRCGDGMSFPYKQSAKDQERARQYSIDFWTSGTWPQQTRPLEWIPSKFWPVPTWSNKQIRRAVSAWNERAGQAKLAAALKQEPAAQPSAPNPLDADANEAQALPSVARTDDGPVISVLIPVRNEPFLLQTLDDLRHHLHQPFEILVGLDGTQDPQKTDMAALRKLPLYSDNRWFIRVFEWEKPIGMRPTLNKLLAAARGRFILKCDAHVAISAGLDDALLAAWEPGAAVTARRFDLDTEHWQRREHSKTDVRRLTHESEDGIGLRSMPWPQYEAQHADDAVLETMTCSGSLFLIERRLWQYWGGWDTEHGHFGQEGAELSCKVWLSGGRLLHVTGAWYAHHNRGKATYAMGAQVKPTSIARSHHLWQGDNWPYQKYSFAWLLEKFAPPGWPAVPAPQTMPLVRMGSPCKPVRKVTIEQLWQGREGISEPTKRHRLTIFWKVFEAFVRSVLAGAPDWEGPYQHYLISHLHRGAQLLPTRRQLHHVRKKMEEAARLTESVRDNGLLAPLEMVRDLERGAMVLWKGYRRLVIAHVLGIEKVAVRALFDRRTALTRSPQRNMTRLRYPASDRGRRIAERQFARHGQRATDKYFVHNYIEWYDRYFPEMAQRCKRLLELGLARGASLAFWREYFPRAELIGGEIDPQRWRQFAGDLENTRVLLGDETDPAYLERLASAGPYDIVIDDADHHPAKQAAVFATLWPALRPHGYYVIEDIYRSFADNGQGRCLPVGLESRLFSEHDGGVGGGDIAEIHWHSNIVFVRKGGA